MEGKLSLTVISLKSIPREKRSGPKGPLFIISTGPLFIIVFMAQFMSSHPSIHPSSSPCQTLRPLPGSLNALTIKLIPERASVQESFNSLNKLSPDTRIALKLPLLVLSWPCPPV